MLKALGQPAEGCFYWLLFALAAFEHGFRGVNHHPGVFLHGAGEEGVAAHHAAPADGGIAAQNGRAGVDGHIVRYGRVALAGLRMVPIPGGQGAQGHALVELYPIADDRGLTHHDARAVVDEEVIANLRAGMDVDARVAVGVLGHHPGQDGDLHFVKLVGYPIYQDGKQAGIGKQDFFSGAGGGIAVKGGLPMPTKTQKPVV